MYGGSLRVLEVFGDSADLGRGHGESCGPMIRKYLEERIRLSSQEGWSGAVADRDLILESAEETLEHHERYAEELYAEMVAMAGAAGVTPAEAVVVGGFTDLVDAVRAKVGAAPEEHNCTAVLNPGLRFYAATWDMHASAGEYVMILKLDPLVGPAAVVQTTTGCLGQMGMNEAGLSVGINNLTSMGRPGVTWPFVVRKVLEQTDLESAVNAVVGADLAGGHNYQIMGPDGEGVNIEAMPREHKITRSRDKPIVHTNHCLSRRTAAEEGVRSRELVDSSNIRLEVGARLANDADALLADPRVSRRVDGMAEVGTCGAVIIEPAERRMRAVWGIPGDHPWETFRL